MKKGNKMNEFIETQTNFMINEYLSSMFLIFSGVLLNILAKKISW